MVYYTKREGHAYLNKNKVNRVIIIIGSVTILMIGGLLFNQINKNHQANQLIIDECFENFDREVTIKKDGFWSPVICEQN